MKKISFLLFLLTLCVAAAAQNQNYDWAAFSWRKELRPADDIVRLNEMLRKYAKSARIPYVDYHSVLKDDNNGLPEKYAADGVHPNIECYRIMEEIILEYLK